MADPETDPLTQLHEALYTHIAESVGVKAAINRTKPNIISYIQENRKILDTPSNVDYPEIQIIRLGGTPVINFSSSTNGYTITYRLIINTGDLRIVKWLLPIDFAIFAALATAVSANVFRDLTWRSQKYVKNVSASSSTIGISDPNKNRGINGWSDVYDFRFETYFARADLATLNNGV